MKISEMNGHEKIAYKNIKHCINYIVGGYYNCLQDDCPEYLYESHEALENEIYESAITNTYGPGYEGYGKAPKEMRFAGESFIRSTIKKLLDKDDDVATIDHYLATGEW